MGDRRSSNIRIARADEAAAKRDADTVMRLYAIARETYVDTSGGAQLGALRAHITTYLRNARIAGRLSERRRRKKVSRG